MHLLHLILAQTTVNQTGNTLTIQFDVPELITWLIIGFIAGSLAELLIRGYGRGIITNIIVGLLGAIVGGFLLTILHPSISQSLYGGITLRYIDILVAFIGAVILLLILGLVFRRRP